jgi:hypothetical protein
LVLLKKVQKKAVRTYGTAFWPCFVPRTSALTCIYQMPEDAHAASQGHQAAVVCLVKELGANVNQADYEGCTPVYAAAEMGYKAVVLCLVKELSADVNIATHDGSTPLMVASQEPRSMRRSSSSLSTAQIPNRFYLRSARRQTHRNMSVPRPSRPRTLRLRRTAPTQPAVARVS